MNPASVLTVVNALGIGGTERAAATFAIGYAKRGLDSRLWAVTDGGPRAIALSSHDVPVHIGSDLKSFIGSWRPDFVHLHSNGLSGETIDILTSLLPDADLVEQNVFSQPTVWSDKLACSFQLTETALLRYRKFPGAVQSTVVPNPVDDHFYFRDDGAAARIRAELSIEPGAFVVGRVGQPSTYKWAPLTVSTFSALADKDPNAHMILVGAPIEIYSLVLRSRHSARIRLLPAEQSDADLRALYSSFDVFLHTSSQGESFGYVLCEAMLCGTPVLTIATPWADNSQGEVVGPGGLVAKSQRQFRELLLRMWAHPLERANLARLGARHIRHRYSSEVVTQMALQTLSVGATLGCGEQPQPLVSWIRGFYLRLNYRLQAKIRLGSWRWIPSKLFERLRLGLATN